MSPFEAISTFSTFSKKDNNISVSIILFLSYCALSTFCSIIFAVNFTGWFFVSVIGGSIKELFKSLNGSEKKSKTESMLDYHRFNHFEDFRLSSKENNNNGLPLIPSCRSPPKSKSNTKSSNKLDPILSIDSSSFADGTDDKPDKNNKKDKNIKKDIPILDKHVKQRHVPDIPSSLGPNRQKSTVDYYPNQRHSHHPKSKLSDTEKMIERTAAYRSGKKCSGWINGDLEEYAIKDQQKDSDDPFYSREPIKELNVRLDQERPKITKQKWTTLNKSPASSLKYARQYLTILLTIKKEMNL